MIRFMPDSWVDVLMRPLDMVSPESAIYVEFMAPDLRPAAVVALSLAVGTTALLRRGASLTRPLAWLLVTAAVAYAAWMATSGNGRYFMPFLILAGPLCAGLVLALPATRAFRITLLLILVIVQGYLLFLRPPWRFMTWLQWTSPPHFQVEAPPRRADPTYVMIEVYPYSLIAPSFPEPARWIRLPAHARPREQAFVQRFLEQGRDWVLVIPASPAADAPDLQPGPSIMRFLGEVLGEHGLSLAAGASCDVLRSRDLARAISRGDPDADAPANAGLWLCPLHFEPGAVATAGLSIDPAVEAVFAAAERLCPRFFRAGESVTRPFAHGFMRSYPGSDTKLYVLNDGTVAYRYWLRLNPETVGTREQVLSGQLAFDCQSIRSPIWRRGGP